jgi:hypothetical protein
MNAWWEALVALLECFCNVCAGRQASGCLRLARGCICIRGLSFTMAGIVWFPFGRVQEAGDLHMLGWYVN